MKEFEEDLKKGEDVTKKDYIDSDKTYSNTIYKIGIGTSNIIEKSFNKLMRYLFSEASDVVNSKHADSTVMNAISKVQDAVKGIVVNDYDEHGKIVKDEYGEPVKVNLSNIDYSNYNEVIKPTIGDIASTRQAYVQDEKYKAAMADASEMKKGK